MLEARVREAWSIVVVVLALAIGGCSGTAVGDPCVARGEN
jgi:hypothetical protein